MIGTGLLVWASLFVAGSGDAEAQLDARSVDAVLAGIDKSAASPDYSAEVLPILSEHCFACHGPDPSSREAELRLDKREVAIEKKAILPGNARDSLLAQRISSTNEKLRMPPKHSRHELSKDEIRTLVLWIERGAVYGRHWAFVAPEDPALPAGKPAWSKHPIDRFVAEHWKTRGFGPAPRADRETLLRRVHLDLVGLPPSLEERERFLADKEEGAYERMVDRVLEMPAYAEHWTAWWLDKARYADTLGYEKDSHRTIWPYRDWVLRAFLEDMPFDRFTTLQLAGDLIEKPSKDSRIATAFHRNTMNNQEGGTDDEEFRVAAVIDRTNTTMNVWMGLTWNCIQCHSHKFDPFSHEEFYKLYAFFNQSKDSDKNDDRPTLVVGSTKDKKGKVHPIRLPVMEELPKEKQRKTYLFLGGNFMSKDKKRGPLAPDTPKALHPFPSGVPHDRLGLADWLLDPANPLTARVQVDRIWARLFGRGIVETLNDFGLQGARPSHPRLLDHLAVTWRSKLGWSFKKLLRYVVTSETYKQSSFANEKQRSRDPYNIHLARGPRRRLESEALRDQALFVAGLLSEKRFGPSVMPWQPEGIWMSVYSGARWRTSAGEDRYRRAVYTYWKRTSPYPSLQGFGTPSREICVVERRPSNTPLQALTLLNDPVFVEAATALAKRVEKEAPSSRAAQIEHAWLLALGRKPRAAEASRALRYLKSASLTELCRVLMNLDEFLSKP